MAYNDSTYNPTISVTELSLIPESSSRTPDGQSLQEGEVTNVYNQTPHGVNNVRLRTFAFSATFDHPIVANGSTSFINNVSSLQNQSLLSIDLCRDRQNSLLAETGSNTFGYTNDEASYLPNHVKITCVPGNWDFPPFVRTDSITYHSAANEQIVYSKQASLIACPVGLSNPAFITATGQGGGTIGSLSGDIVAPEFSFHIGVSTQQNQTFYRATQNGLGMLDMSTILSGSSYLEIRYSIPAIVNQYTSSASSFTLANQSFKGLIEIY